METAVVTVPTEHPVTLDGGLEQFDEAVRNRECPYLNQLGEMALESVREAQKAAEAGDIEALAAMAAQLAANQEAKPSKSDETVAATEVRAIPLTLDEPTLNREKLIAAEVVDMQAAALITHQREQDETEARASVHEPAQHTDTAPLIVQAIEPERDRVIYASQLSESKVHEPEQHVVELDESKTEEPVIAAGEHKVTEEPAAVVINEGGRAEQIVTVEAPEVEWDIRMLQPTEGVELLGFDTDEAEPGEPIELEAIEPDELAPVVDTMTAIVIEEAEVVKASVVEQIDSLILEVLPESEQAMAHEQLLVIEEFLTEEVTMLLADGAEVDTIVEATMSEELELMVQELCELLQMDDTESVEHIVQRIREEVLGKLETVDDAQVKDIFHEVLAQPIDPKDHRVVTALQVLLGRLAVYRPLAA